MATILSYKESPFYKQQQNKCNELLNVLKHRGYTIKYYNNEFKGLNKIFPDYDVEKYNIIWTHINNTYHSNIAYVMDKFYNNDFIRYITNYNEYIQNRIYDFILTFAISLYDYHIDSQRYVTNRNDKTIYITKQINTESFTLNDMMDICYIPLIYGYMYINLPNGYCKNCDLYVKIDPIQ